MQCDYQYAFAALSLLLLSRLAFDHHERVGKTFPSLTAARQSSKSGKIFGRFDPTHSSCIARLSHFFLRFFTLDILLCKLANRMSSQFGTLRSYATFIECAKVSTNTFMPPTSHSKLKTSRAAFLKQSFQFIFPTDLPQERQVFRSIPFEGPLPVCAIFQVQVRVHRRTRRRGSFHLLDCAARRRVDYAVVPSLVLVDGEADEHEGPLRPAIEA